MTESVQTNVSVTPQITLDSTGQPAATVEASQNLAAALVKSSQIQAQATAQLLSLARPNDPAPAKPAGPLSNPINLGLAALLAYLAWK